MPIETLEPEVPTETGEGKATLVIVNPVAESQVDLDDSMRDPPAPRPADLNNKRVALYWNGKQNGKFALDAVRDLLSKRFTGLSFIDVTGELGGVNRFLSPGQLDMLERDADVAICTTADCGSCTAWLMRDLCDLERRGIPAIAYTAAIFDEDSRFSTKTFGVPEAVPLIVPREGEPVERLSVRFRTVGDVSCTCPVASTAATPADIIAETAVTTITERGATRMDDQTSEASMERRKKQGYF